MSDDLQRMGITGPVDLLRDFWWSRRECLVLTEGVDANTDLRLLSEEDAGWQTRLGASLGSSGALRALTLNA